MASLTFTGMRIFYKEKVIHQEADMCFGFCYLFINLYYDFTI